MPEPIEQEQETADDTETETEPTTDQPQDKKAKVTLTPEQQLFVNSLLKREREKEAGKWTSLLEQKDAEITDLSEGWDAILEAQIADFPPAVKLLLKDMSVVEQRKKLQDEQFMKSVRTEKKPPVTPKSDGTHDAKPAKVVPFGGR